jgi:site-specific DNA-methyltransferase (cytosine-N4-specific)
MRIIHGDCLAFLPTLADNSVQCVVTSPPYFGLRDYGTGTWEGGDPSCGHRKIVDPSKSIASSRLQSPHASGGIGHRYEGYRHTCGKCGARRIDQQIGLEQTPEDYIAKLVAVFREVKRVLCPDGTVWLNIGDSYATPGGKRKDLLMIPARVALALQADGWYVRSDIILHKRDPMPESVKDRPTNCHEHVFLLTKQRRYYYDAAAIAEPAVTVNDARGPGRHRSVGKWQRDRAPGGAEAFAHIGSSRNCRNVWTISTESFKGAHFATMPVKLAERCILAGTKPGDMVLDPFGGTGTTAQAALYHGRDAILIELNADYIKLAEHRLAPYRLLSNAAD